MKISIDPKKSVEAVSGLLQKTADFGKKTVADVQASAVALSEKTKQDNYLRRLKKYNPLFPDVYFSSEFNLPNMIMIRDDAERRGIDVCEGAIGWLGNEGGMEVLYLYDEAIASSGIQFVPSADCNAVYYVDKFDRKKFVRTDCIFELAHDERLAELEHIAYSLGAKRCTIDISVTDKSIKKTKNQFRFAKKANMHLQEESNDEETCSVDGDAIVQVDSHYELTHKQESKRCSELAWEGSDNPKKPRLKWFAYDNGVKGLIEMRCKAGNKVNHRTLKIYGSSSSTMSKDTACRIDSALSCIAGSYEGKSGGKRNAELESKVIKESERIFIYNVEF